MREVNRDLLVASTVLGEKVTNAEGESLGELRELVIDTHSGRIAYAVLAFGGILGIGEKMFAVPWEAFRLSEQEHKLHLDVPKEKLKDAPGFDKGNWPVHADREFQGQVYSFYGYAPYWHTPAGAPSKASDTSDLSEAGKQEQVTSAYGAASGAGSALLDDANLGAASTGTASSIPTERQQATQGQRLEDTSYGADYGSETGGGNRTKQGNSSSNVGDHDNMSNSEKTGGTEEGPQDRGGSPARGYGRGGINSPEDIDDSMNPGPDILSDAESEGWQASQAEMTDRGTNTGDEDRGGTDAASGRDLSTTHLSSGPSFIGATGAGPGGSDLGAREVGPRGENLTAGGLSSTVGTFQDEARQRQRGEEAADEFNPGLTGSTGDLESSRSQGGTAEGGPKVPGDTRAFDREQGLPARGEPGPANRISDVSGASGLSSSASTGGSEGLSAAEDLEIGSVDDLNVVGTNLGPEYPTDMTVTEDEDTEQSKDIRPGAQRGHSSAGDLPAGDPGESDDDTRGDVGSTGTGRGHSSGSSTGRHHRGSRGGTTDR